MAHHITNDTNIKNANAFAVFNFALLSWGKAKLSALLFASSGGRSDQAFLWSPVCFALGIGVYFSLTFEPGLWVGGGAVFASVLTLIVLRKLFLYHDFYRLAFMAVMAIALFSGGFMAAQMRTKMVHTPILLKKVGPVDIVGVVDLIDVLPGGRGARVILSDVEIERVDHPPRRVRLKISKAQDLKIGQRVTVLGVLNPPSAPLMPGGFDFARHMYFKGIGGVGFAYRQPEVVEVHSHGAQQVGWFSAAIQKLRLSMSARIMAVLPQRSGALASALIVGNKKAIDGEDQDAMRSAGLAHLLAISGLHVGLVSGILFFFARLVMAAVPRFALRHPIKKYAALIALFGGVAYMLIAGASIPTQRAVLMSGVVLSAVMFDRMAISLRLVAFAALVVLSIAPESLLSASFHLSFAAVTALIAFYSAVRPVFARWNAQGGVVRRVLLYLGGVCLTSIIATLATMPFAMFHFQQVASYGLLGNFVAVPLMGFVIMPTGILAVMLMPFGLEYYPLLMMNMGIEAVLDLAHWIYNLQGSLLYVSAWPRSAMLCFVAAGLFSVLFRGWFKVLALVPLVGAVVAFSTHKMPDILVSPNLKLVMSRQDDGMFVVSTNRRDKFTRENWQRYFGVQDEALVVWPKIEGDGLRCDDGACRSVIKGYKISLVKDHYAQRDECAWADIVISQEPIQWKLCEAAYRIGKWEGWRNGAYAVYLADDGVEVVNAQTQRGVRPWVVHKGKK